MSTPQVANVRRHSGIAGNYSMSADVTYPGEDTTTAVFVGSVYGGPGPVIAVMPSGAQVFVTDPGRFGPILDHDWVRRYFAEGQST